MAEQKGCGPAQLALAWLLAQGEDIVPIPGTKRRKYLEENVTATDIKLSVQDIDEIKAIAPPGIAVGDRYDTGAMRSVNL
jgi:aryl-alcohol dehydrogenase-like predicted oxidoreductase